MKRSEIKRRPLQDATLSGLEPELKEYREIDSNGLYFRVKPDGNKSWQLRYKKPNGVWSWFGIGGYPEISGRLARQKASEARQLIANGIDPKEHRDEQKQALLNSDQFSFKSLAEEYCNSKNWVDGTRTRNIGALVNHVYPAMGNRDYRKITKKEWLSLIQQIQQKLHPKTGKPIVEMGNRVRGLCKEIYDLAEVTERIDHNPLSGIEKFIAKHKKQNMEHVNIDELPKLLVDIRSYPSPTTSIALQLLSLLACRPNELREAVWHEFNFEKSIWVIPSERMKKRIEHTIPLPRQALELLSELKSYCGNSPYLFKSRSNSSKPVSNNTFNKALKSMGYQGRQTSHGFRHIFSTQLRELGFSRDHVEAALAHKVSGVEGIYNKAIYVEPRKEMMQSWADYLDKLVQSAIRISAA